MRDVTLAGLNEVTSCLGFGCASLGSRVSAGQGARALARAHEQGVRWFDVAPAYGAGQAEPILGAALKGREGVQICTKVGLIPPPQNRLKQAVRGLLRPVVGMVRPLRAAIRKTGATANRSVALTPERLHASLEQSLTRLGTDHVAVYALHNADPADLARDDILRALEDLRAAGKTRAVSVAGGLEVAQAVIAAGGPVDIIQLAHPEDPAIIAAATAAGIGCVTHTVFGVAGDLAKLTRHLARTPALAQRVSEAGYTGTPEAQAAALLMARAFAANPDGVVLASMFSDRSLQGNLSGAMSAPRPDALTLTTEVGL